MSTVPLSAPADRESAVSVPESAVVQSAGTSLWRGSAPKQLKSLWKQSEYADAWDVWRAYLAERKPIGGLLGESLESLAWGLPVADARPLSAWTAELEAAIDDGGDTSRAEALLAEWVGEAPERLPSTRLALEALALAGAAAKLAPCVNSAVWWSLVDVLAALADEASQAAAPEPAETEAVVVEQLLAGELPLVLSTCLPEMRPLHELASAASDALSGGLDRLTDGEGLLAGPLWADPETPGASMLLACWTRCRSLGGSKRGPWTSDSQLQYEWLVRQALRVSDREGRLALHTEAHSGAPELLRTALRFGGDDSDLAAASLRLRSYRADDSFEAPASSNHSEWAEIGVLSANWRDKAPRIVVAHPADTMRVEVYAGKQPLLLGDWPVEVSIGGETLEPTDEWDCQCWYTDEDCDYLELALDLTGGARLERLFFLSREDGVGFLAEALFSEQAEARDAEIVSRLPLASTVGLRPERETRDALLTVGGEPSAGVLPLALAEWRDEHRGGELTAEDGRLVLSRQGRGRNLVSPLWLDFYATRFNKQRTWRQLTVAESLKKVADDVAVAYRAQAGKEQWVVYRSLDDPANRTFLGHNLSSEALVGTFEKDGTVDEYFEIEADE